MVPTLLLLGLVFGRWWRTTLLVAALGWPLLLLVSGIIDPGWAIAGAAGLAAVNTGIGIVVHQGLRWCLQHRPTARARPAGPGERRTSDPAANGG